MAPASVPDRGAAGSLSGGCMCGAVRFELSKPAREAGWCHCTRCQRRSGGAASANASIDPASLTIVSGSESLRAWNPGDGGFEKLFCVQCGSQMLSRDSDPPERMSVRMGAFDGDPGVRPAFHQFVDYAAPWQPIPEDGLPRYAEGRPR